MTHPDTFTVSSYLFNGIKRVLWRVFRFSFRNPSAFFFITCFSLTAYGAKKRRDRQLKTGHHVPPFLIASITKNCNLFCTGCYSRELNKKNDCSPKNELNAAQWAMLFDEAASIGVSFILLAGGEPLMRRDVLEQAAMQKKILFPVFTNGTLLDDAVITLFSANRNLFPVLSIEGKAEYTDSRRGNGISSMLKTRMKDLQERRILFGVSITVTASNLAHVTHISSLSELRDAGCAAVIFVEYVPVTPDSATAALDESGREHLEAALFNAKKTFKDLILISFPGDEKYMGGCLAAGRGFFHINAVGGVEPCPFSPYSDLNITSGGLSKAVDSPLFLKLKTTGLLQGEHTGGCTLFVEREKVSRLLAETLPIHDAKK